MCCGVEFGSLNSAKKRNEVIFQDFLLTYCMKHTNMIWHQIQSTKVKGRDCYIMNLWILSVPLAQYRITSCGRFGLFSKISKKAEHIFKNIQMYITVAKFSREGQHLQIGIMTE